MDGRVVSVNVGMPQTREGADGKPFTSAIGKEPVALGTRVAIAGQNLAGDSQANRKYHGGPDKVLCCYSVEHFPAWTEEFGAPMAPGAFGENLTLAGMTEESVCVGDRLRIGGALLEVSQPRQPCVNIRRRWGIVALPRRMEETGRTGFYLRVVAPGEVGPGDAVLCESRIHPEWSVARANAVMYGPSAGEEIAALRAVGALSAEWKRILGRKLRRLA